MSLLAYTKRIKQLRTYEERFFHKHWQPLLKLKMTTTYDQSSIGKKKWLKRHRKTLEMKIKYYS